MILVRTVLQAKFGKAHEIVEQYKNLIAQLEKTMEGAAGRTYLLTDLSGRFDTVVLEAEYESMAAWEQFRAQLFSRPEFQTVFGQMAGLIESGQSELYTIEMAWPGGQ